MVIIIFIICVLAIVFAVYISVKHGTYRVQKHTDMNNQVTYEVSKYNSAGNKWIFVLRENSESEALIAAETLRNKDRAYQEKLKNVNDVTIKKFKP